MSVRCSRNGANSTGTFNDANLTVAAGLFVGAVGSTCTNQEIANNTLYNSGRSGLVHEPDRVG